MTDATTRRCIDCGNPHGRKTKTRCSPCERARIPEAPCTECTKPCRPFVGGRCAACYHRRRPRWRQPGVVDCPQCFRPHRPRADGRGWCSHTCANRAKNGVQPTRGELVRRPEQWLPTTPTVEIPGGWFCAGDCMICGNSFTSRARGSTCSDACKTEARARTQRAKYHKRRARKRGAPHERINSTDVFDAAGWTCAACHVPVTTWQGHWTPTLATLDHIVPIARGGSHTRDNVQCLCALCNSLKRDLMPGEAVAA